MRSKRETRVVGFGSAPVGQTVTSLPSPLTPALELQLHTADWIVRLPPMRSISEVRARRVHPTTKLLQRSSTSSRYLNNPSICARSMLNARHAAQSAEKPALISPTRTPYHWLNHEHTLPEGWLHREGRLSSRWCLVNGEPSRAAAALPRSETDRWMTASRDVSTTRAAMILGGESWRAALRTLAGSLM